MKLFLIIFLAIIAAFTLIAAVLEYTDTANKTEQENQRLNESFSKLMRESAELRR
jgi:hypothetical protein